MKFQPLKSSCILHCLLVILITLLSLQLGCKKSPSGPDEPKNPREYTWTTDTLKYPGSFQTMMYEIWSSNPEDAYVVGHNDRAFGKMYHFDGGGWKPVDLAFGLIDLHDVLGFGARNVIAVGVRLYPNSIPPPNFLDSSLIIRYDGAQWREEKVQGRNLAAIDGIGSNDVWACGWEGTLFHYDGVSWKRIPMDQRDRFYDVKAISSDEVYLLGERTNPSANPPVYEVRFRYDGTRWSLMDSMEVTYKFGVIGTTLYALTDGLLARRGGVWQKEFTAPAPLQGMHAASPTNAFVVGIGSLIYHYDGQTWLRLQNVISGEWWLEAVWTFDREVFIVGHDYGGNKSIILHGR